MNSNDSTSRPNAYEQNTARETSPQKIVRLKDRLFRYTDNEYQAAIAALKAGKRQTDPATRIAYLSLLILGLFLFCLGNSFIHHTYWKACTIVLGCFFLYCFCSLIASRIHPIGALLFFASLAPITLCVFFFLKVYLRQPHMPTLVYLVPVYVGVMSWVGYQQYKEKVFRKIKEIKDTKMLEDTDQSLSRLTDLLPEMTQSEH
jgi:hypothetical protein